MVEYVTGAEGGIADEGKGPRLSIGAAGIWVGPVCEKGYCHDKGIAFSRGGKKTRVALN